MQEIINGNREPGTRRLIAAIIAMMTISGACGAPAEPARPSDDEHGQPETITQAAKRSAHVGDMPAQDGNSTVVPALAPRDFAAAPGDASSSARAGWSGSRTTASLRRDNGDFLSPFVRYDLSRQRTTTHAYATANRLEVGAGKIALWLEDNLIGPQGANGAVRVDHQMLLFREIDKDGEIDVGFGQTVISAAQRSNVFSVSVSARAALPYHLAAELHGIFSAASLLYLNPNYAQPGDFSDVEAALHARTRYGSLKIGYRWLEANYDSATRGFLTHQSGVFAGFSLYY